MALLLAAFNGHGQEYAITKLKLFPDRDEVLVKDVSVDSLGFIWFLTNGEIYRYDGYRSLDILKTISDQRLTDDMPQRILIDDRNRLWMAGNANLSYLDLKTWKVHAIDPNLLPPIQDRAVYAMAQLADSTVLVAYENGHLLLLKGDQHIRIDELYEQGKAASNKVSPRSMTFWKGNIWVGTTGGGLLSIDPRRNWQAHFRELPGLQALVKNLVARGDTLFLDVSEPVHYRFEEGVVTQINPADFAISEDKYYVLKEGNGRHAYADDEAIYLLDANIRLRQRLPIPSKHRFRTTSVNLVGEEALLGTEEGIFVAYPKTSGLSQLIPVNPGANKSTRGIYVYPDGALFYATYNGAGYIAPDGSVQTFQELRHGYALLPMNDNELLVGTEGGFLKVFNRSQRRITDFRYTLSENAREKYAAHLPIYVMCLAETKTDYLIGGMNGLWLLDKKNHRLDRYELTAGQPHALDIQIRYIQQRSGHDLLLSTNIGLFALHKGVLTKKYPKSGNIGVFKSIVVNDTLWLATQGDGLVAIDAEGRVLRRLTTAEGLSNNLIYSLEWLNGVMVVGTANGLNLIDGQQRIRRIGTAEGLSQSEFNSGASFLDTARNRIFVGGLMGYTVLDMTYDWFKGRDQLESYVTEIHTLAGHTGTKSADYSWPYRGERTLVLQPGQSLTGLFVGTPGNYRADSEIRYAFNNGTWEPLELGQFISLIEPSPGSYRIQLQTRSTGTGSVDKEITVVKQPYYFQTWWFTALIIAVVLLLLALWYRSRIQKIRREQAIRNRIAADLHDEVGSSLTRIFFQANTLSATSRMDEKQGKQLELIADTSKQALLTMSDMVWSIDSRFDTMKELIIRMKDYLYKLREELDFSYRFEEHGDMEAGRVSQTVRQNLFLIFKEALTNAIKYSDGSEIVISLHVGATVRLVVGNHYTRMSNGVADQQGGRGLENMRLRAAKTGGTLSVMDEHGMFQLTLDLPPKRGI